MSICKSTKIKHRFNKKCENYVKPDFCKIAEAYYNIIRFCPKDCIKYIKRTKRTKR